MADDAAPPAARNLPLSDAAGEPAFLERLIHRARLTLAWEQAWPLLARAAAAPGLAVALAWLGVLARLPAPLRLVVLATLALATLAALVPLARLRMPGRAAALARLDRGTGNRPLPHRPATALADRLSAAATDSLSQALWAAHLRAAAAATRGLRLGGPRPALASRDPYALRIALLLALVVGFFQAGPERLDRLVGLFSAPLPAVAETPVRIDAWVTPPAYTRRPPIMLTGRAEGGDSRIQVPENSTVVVRVAGDPQARITTDGEAVADTKTEQSPSAAQGPSPKPVQDSAAPASQIVEQRLTLRGDASVAVQREGRVATSYRFAVIPDRAPTVALDGPVRSAARGGMTLGYRVTDDYGVASVEARIVPAAVPGSRPLYTVPTVPLSLPANRLNGSAQTTRDLSDHPFAGAPVTLTLAARDDAGHEGLSEPLQTTLPGRAFVNPLARALVEQRRTLALDAGQAKAVQGALDALMIAPEQFTKDAGVYLGLRTARARLAGARGDEALRGVVAYLWQIALDIEDGSMSDAERQLKAAREALRQAMERGASPEEIQRLTQELRQALNTFLQEYARRQAQQQNGRQQNQQSGNQQTVTPKDLNQMLDRMEQAMREGSKSEAEQLLSQLDDVLQNLASPNRQMGEQDPASQEMERALGEMSDMIQRQQRLRDQTFQSNRDPQAGEDGQQGGDEQQAEGDQGQQGQEGQDGDQTGPNGQGEDGQQGAEGQDGSGQPGIGQEGQGQQGQGQRGMGQQGMGQQGRGSQSGRGGQGQAGRGSQGTPSLGELRQRQQALRNQLQAMRKRLQAQGAPDTGGLDQAEQAMRDAEGQLQQGDAGGAVASQGRALQALRQGAQAMAQAMQQGQQGQGQQAGRPGRGQRQGQGTGNGEETDPLGRPMRSRGYSDGTVKVPGRGETAAQRAARVLDELRRRYADPTRPTGELDYLQRLLRQE